MVDFCRIFLATCSYGLLCASTKLHTALLSSGHKRQIIAPPILLNCVICKKPCRSAGILTSFPSSTPLGFDLGPTNPQLIVIAEETLVLRRTGFSPVMRLLMPAFALRCAPANFTVDLRCSSERFPTIPWKIHGIPDFGIKL